MVIILRLVQHDGKVICVNASNIQYFAEYTPARNEIEDENRKTYILMTGGRHFFVRETVDDIENEINDWQHQ